MKPSQALEQHRMEVRRIVQRYRARNARVFGSALRGQDNEESDLDLLVDPADNMTLFDIGAIRYELRELLGVEVDVVTPNALPDSFRDKVLNEAVPV
jgi:predicted nucleotidyltransferase